MRILLTEKGFMVEEDLILLIKSIPAHENVGKFVEFPTNIWTVYWISIRELT